MNTGTTAPKLVNGHVSVSVPMSTRKALKWDTEKSAWSYETITGTVTLTINMQAVLEDLGGKALCNKTGKASDLCGLVRAEATGRSRQQEAK